MGDKESVVRQEDCNEDSLGVGILTLTNQRIVFDKTRSRMLDFTKRPGETAFEAPLDQVSAAWKEGLLMKKVCITVGDKSYKFGVMGTGGWLEAIQDACGLEPQ